MRVPVLAFVGLFAFATAVRADKPLKTTAESGPVKATVTLEPAKPLIGDPVTLTITVTAEKNVELLMPEFGEALERFSVIDFVPRESIDDQGRTVSEQQYRLQPPSSGKQAIPPILIEYVDRRPGQRNAPEGMDAYELLTDRLEFAVQSVIPSDAKADLEPPLGKLPPRERASGPWWPWMAAVAVVLVAASPFAARAFLAWRRRARRLSAYQIARSRLDRLLARPRPSGEHLDAFYVELSGIVRRYLEDRFELRSTGVDDRRVFGLGGSLTCFVSRSSSTAARAFARSGPGEVCRRPTVQREHRRLDRCRPSIPGGDTRKRADDGR